MRQLLRSQQYDHQEPVPVVLNWQVTLLAKVLIPSEGALLPRVRDVQPGCADIQVFIKFVNFY